MHLKTGHAVFDFYTQTKAHSNNAPPIDPIRQRLFSPEFYALSQSRNLLVVKPHTYTLQTLTGCYTTTLLHNWLKMRNTNRILIY